MTVSHTFEALPLAAPLQRALRDKNYEVPSPIQAQAIPKLLEGHDLLGAAQTGTGKTAAFALPILHAIHERPRRPNRHTARALVLTPTRELAVQVAKSFETYGQHMRLSTALVYGGVSAGPQVKALRRGIDILIATPGRLLDLFGQGHIDFSEIEFFVLDEADRMLDMGFINDIRKVVEELPAKRQSLFFSATLSDDITRLAGDILTNPVEVRIAPKTTTAENIDHAVCFLKPDNKFDLLNVLLEEQESCEGRNLTLVFTRTKYGAEKLAKMVNRAGFRADAIHGNKSQAARQRALDDFRKGRTPVLVATDVAARGIDVKDITLVVNFDMPVEPESYVHRIGRTARAGAEGVALSFCTSDELDELLAIEKLINREILVFEDHDYHHRTLAERYVARRTQKASGRHSGNGRGNSQRQGRRGGPSRSSDRRRGDRSEGKGRSSSGGNRSQSRRRSSSSRQNRSRRAASPTS